MARAGRKDRGLLAKKDSMGKTLWHVRLYHEGKERRFGAFNNKTEARDFYEKAKQEQKQGRFFPERYQHGRKELASAVIASYLTTLPTSGKKPTTIVEEKYYGRWWTDRLTGKACTPCPLPCLTRQWRTLLRNPTCHKPSSIT